MNPLFDAATQIQNQAVRQWKEEGKQVIGYTCSFVPPEILHAAGLLPFRLRGIKTDGMEIGDSYYGPFICSFPKCILQLAGKGEYRFLDGIIITPGCDAMRRLHECWRSAEKEIPNITPGFFYYLGVPHKASAQGLAWFTKELRSMITGIETHFNTTITDEKLNSSIKSYNKGRTLLSQLDNMRLGGALSGTELFAATIADTALPKEVSTPLLEKWVLSLAEAPPRFLGPPRLMLLGSISDDLALVELIEQAEQAVVVAENLCFGLRQDGSEVPEEGDPIEMLARHYLGGSACPRMFGGYEKRLERVRKKARGAGVDGVILQNIRFCDLHGAENALLEKDLEAMGIPCLRLEREYGPLTETGRINLRIRAFLERISTARRAS